jgi:hypothetical protein
MVQQLGDNQPINPDAAHLRCHRAAKVMNAPGRNRLGKVAVSPTLGSVPTF